MILDSFFIKLGIDAKDANSGVDKLTREVGKFLAVLGGSAALKSFISDTTESNAAIGRLATNLGMGVESLSAWAQAADRAGGSAQGMQSTIDMLSRAQTELQITGQSSLVPYLSMLGVSLADVGGKARPTTDILLDMSERFSHMDRAQSFNIGRMMGLDPGTMNLILKGRGEVERMIARQKEIGVVTKQQAEQSQRLQSAWRELSQTMAAGGRDMLSQLAPALETITGWVQKFFNFLSEHGDFVNGLLIAIAGSMALLVAAATPLSGTVTLVAALAGAFALLYEDYQKWKLGEESLLDWSKWSDWSKGVGSVVDWVYQKLSRLFFEMARGADIVGGIIDMDKERIKRAWSIEYESPKTVAGEDFKPKQAGSTSYGELTQYLMQRHGLKPHQAQGIAKNIQAESAFSASAVGDNGKAYGLAQWHPDRQARFSQWAGKPIQGSSWREQTDFMMYELHNQERGALRALLGTQNWQDATVAFAEHYERPANKHVEARRRAGLGPIPGATSALATSGQIQQSAGGVSNQTISIGKIDVHTAATDAAGIANDLAGQLNTSLTAQSVGGFR